MKRKGYFCITLIAILLLSNSHITSAIAMKQEADGTSLSGNSVENEDADSEENDPKETDLQEQESRMPDGLEGVSFGNWEDLASEESDDIEAETAAEEESVEKAGDGETRTIYYDATLSKVNYSDGNGQAGTYKVSGNTNSIPLSDGKVYYIAWKNSDTAQYESGLMTKCSEYNDGANTYKDVYEAQISLDYDCIRFVNSSIDRSSVADAEQRGGGATESLSMPDQNSTDNCFYADDGDMSVYLQQVASYDGALRSGKWGKLHQVMARGDAAVDIEEASPGESDHKPGKLYVNTTFYDYFSDWEINGNNRDNSAAIQSTGNDDTYDPGLAYYETTDSNHWTNRTYMTHRIFDMALSDRYAHEQAVNPLYFGHFQWKHESSYIDHILADLNLYGSENTDKLRTLYYNNNSEYRPDHYNCQIGDNSHTHVTDIATQGLVVDQLGTNGELLLETSGGGNMVAPFFDKSFLTGTNSFHTAMGKVYPNVSFPFTKNKEDYWEFDSAQKTIDSNGESQHINLRMKKDGEKYFLAETKEEIRGFVNAKKTADPNFFPFNTANEDGQVNKLNYCFGMRMDINFRLTDSGKIKDKLGNDRDIEFKFSGDDDIWIFLDGKLVMDIGGGHGKVEGVLNFAEKKAVVSGVKTRDGQVMNTGLSLNAADETKSGSYNYTTISDFRDKLDGDSTTQHTLTMFYMERGLWESNMKLTFNFPQDNILDVEKEVNSEQLNSLFADDTNVKTHIGELQFDYKLQNLATHYGNVSVKAMDDSAAEAGFIMPQDKISDYDSTLDGNFHEVNGARYSLFGRAVSDSGKLGGLSMIGSKEGNLVSGGTFRLQDHQLARFNNKFRKGSYLRVTEASSPMLKKLSDTTGDQILKEVFDTKWSVYDGDNVTAVGGTDLTKTTTWVEGDSSLADQSLQDIGSTLTVYDKRTEKILGTPMKDMNGNEITNNTKISQNPPDDVLLFRSYSDPDSETDLAHVRVKYVNTFKTGSITIEKKQGDASDPLTGTYTFDVEFDNVAGLHLEDVWDDDYEVTTDNKLRKSYTLGVNEKETITGIPVGTSYTITEQTPTDGSRLTGVTDSAQAGGAGNDDVTITGNKVTGIVAADADAATVNTFTFYNRIPQTPTIRVKKVDKDYNTQAISGAKFTLRKLKASGAVDTSIDPIEAETNESGIATFSGLGDGSYRLTEKTAPNNYKLADAIYRITLSEGKYTLYNGATLVKQGSMDSNVVELSVENERSTGSIAIRKAQADGSQELAAKYTFKVVFDKPANASGLYTARNWITPDSGNDTQFTKTYQLSKGEVVQINNIPAGTRYTIAEVTPTDSSVLVSVADSLAVAAPAEGVEKDDVSISAQNVVTGYVAPDTETGAAYVQTFTFYNALIPDTTLRVEKVDSSDKKVKLEGATFALTKLDASGNKDESFTVVSKTTGEDGIASFAGLKDGTYSLVETKAPDNYNIISNGTVKVQLENGMYRVNGGTQQKVVSQSITITVKNSKIPDEEDPEDPGDDGDSKDSGGSGGSDTSGTSQTPSTPTTGTGTKLPKTGAADILPFTIAGVLCMSGGSCTLLYGRKKKKREETDKTE